MPEIWFADVTVKTKIASVTEKIVCTRMSDEEMQADKHVAKKLLRLENQGFKGVLEKDKKTGFPLIEKIVWLKYLSEATHG